MRSVAGLLLAAAAALGETGVSRTGEILRGQVVVEKGRSALAAGGETRPFSDFFLVEREDGTAVWAPDFESRLRAYEILARRRAREGYVVLARKAIQARAADLARQCFELAERAGLAGREADRLVGRIELLERSGVRPYPAPRAAVAAGMEEVGGSHAALLVEHARGAF
ncbi:MAG: hypothetical protein ACE5JG_09675, partial [Planctomycetota bacterium]